MRLLGWQIQPVIFADDGDDLTAVQVQAQTIPASQWQAFKDGGDETALETLRAQVEGPGAQPAPLTDPASAAD